MWQLVYREPESQGNFEIWTNGVQLIGGVNRLDLNIKWCRDLTFDMGFVDEYGLIGFGNYYDNHPWSEQ